MPADAPEFCSLISNPSLLLTMEPARVLVLLEQADDTRSRAIAAVYQAAADLPRTVSAVQRRQVLMLNAARMGEPELAACLEKAGVPGQPRDEWGVAWTSGAAPDSRLLRTFSGHTTSVTSVATAVVNGRPVAVSAGRDAVVRVWDLATGGLRHELVADRTDPVSSMTPELLDVATAAVDGHPLALTLHTGEDEAVHAWDLDTGCSVGEIVSVVESTTLDGCPVVLTMGSDRTLGVWDLKTGALRGDFTSTAAIGVLDGRLVAVTDAGDQPTRVWDVASGRQIGECLPVLDAFQLEERRAFALAGPKGEAQRVWDLSTGRPLGGAEIAELDMGDAEALSTMSALTVVHDRVVAITLDGQGEPELVGDWAAEYCDGAAAIRKRQTAVLGARRVALCAGADQELHVWDFSTSAEPVGSMRSLRSISAEDGLQGLSPDPAERTDRWDLISGRRGGRIRSGNAVGIGPRATSRPVEVQERMVSLAAEADGTVRVLDAVEGWPSGRPLIGHTDRVCAIDTAHTRQGLVAVSAGLDQTVRVWDLVARHEQGEALAGHTGQVWDVATTVVDRRPVAVTAGDDRTVRVWDLARAQGDRQHRTGHTGAVLSLATTMVNGDPVAVTAGTDRTVRTWALATGEQVTAPLRIETHVMTTAVVEGHAVVVTAGTDATLRAVDAVTGQDVSPPMPSRHGRVLALATTTLDDVPIAVTAGTDRSLGVWDLAAGSALLDPLTGHSSLVTAVATTVVDGLPVAVTGSWDKSVRLWDLTNGRQIGEPLTGHTDWVTSVACVAVGGEAAAVTTGRDGTVRLWNLTAMTQITSHEATEAGSSGVLAAFNTDTRRLVVVVGHEHTLRFLDATTGLTAAPDYLLPLPVHALTAAPDGYLVAAFGPEVASLKFQVAGAGEAVLPDDASGAAPK